MQQGFDADMKKFASALPAEKHYYRQALEETFNAKGKAERAKLADANGRDQKAQRR